ncbi:transposase [Caloranaerobacter sp. DY30410]|uniref:transposase n=1 Tax=Caloranaerobacter sp. DY30410 TaxID=3238305 RepID=UPI003CFF9EDB
MCPQGQILECKRYRKIQGEKYKVYSNFEACKKCVFKDKCTKAKKGREVIRWVHQDLLDEIDKQTKENKEKYKQRQMIVEHPFGTIKRGLDS